VPTSKHSMVGLTRRLANGVRISQAKLFSTLSYASLTLAGTDTGNATTLMPMHTVKEHPKTPIKTSAASSHPCTAYLTLHGACYTRPYLTVAAASVTTCLFQRSWPMRQSTENSSPCVNTSSTQQARKTPCRQAKSMIHDYAQGHTQIERVQKRPSSRPHNIDVRGEEGT